MKNLIKNDDAISVVVGAVLILAVLVTFMSIVTSTWIPVYEGNAESDHSDATQRTFMDISKQIEYADEFTNYATIDLGTEDMSFIQDSNSVGLLEVNESSGGLFLITNITRIDYPESSVSEFGLNIIGINLSSDAPLSEFEFDLTQTVGTVTPDTVDANFMFQMVTTNNRWITLYNSNPSTEKDVGFVVKYGDPTVKWEKKIPISNVLTTPDMYEITVNSIDYAVLHVDMLDSITTLTLDTDTNYEDQEINGTVYNSTNPDAPLHDIIQHWAKLGGSNYFIQYMQYAGVTEGKVYATVENASQFNTSTNGSVYTVTFNNTNGKIGGGTLTMRSDYNFMVDQSYVYDSGAVFLSQNDGGVLKVKPPILISNNSGTLDIILTGVVLKGDYQASGNDVETLQTTLVGNARLVNGKTNHITIVKETTPEYYDFWRLHFEELNKSVNEFTNITATLNNNTAHTNMTLTINDDISTQNIDITVNTKIIQVSG